jgi:hypothetical protein
MLFTRLAVVTCAIYLGLNLLLEAAVFALALWKGGAGIHFSSRTSMVVFFGAVWLLSFTLAWRIVAAPIFAKIPR